VAQQWTKDEIGHALGPTQLGKFSDPAKQKEDEEDQGDEAEDAAGNGHLQQHQDDRDDDEKTDQRSDHLTFLLFLCEEKPPQLTGSFNKTAVIQFRQSFSRKALTGAATFRLRDVGNEHLYEQMAWNGKICR
jgi:hypothetical protein